jgi:hypothetical protein
VKEELNGVGMSCLAQYCISSPKHPHPGFGWDQHASFLHLCSRHVSFFMGIGTSLRIPTTLYAVLCSHLPWPGLYLIPDRPGNSCHSPPPSPHMAQQC